MCICTRAWSVLSYTTLRERDARRRNPSPFLRQTLALYYTPLLATQDEVPSIWTLLDSKRQSFINHNYNSWPLSKGPLLPSCSIQRLRVWDLFLPPLRLAASQSLHEIGWLQLESRSLEWEGRRPDGVLCNARVSCTSRKIDPSRGTEYTLYHIVVESTSGADDGFVEMDDVEVRLEIV